MSTANRVWLELSPEELDALEVLRKEMGASSADEVMHSLIRQAHMRAAIVCPNCGHAAQLTAEDQARCESCFSVLQLGDEVWRIVVSRPESEAP